MKLSAEKYHADQVGNEISLSVSIGNLLLNKSPRHAWLAHPRLNPSYVAEEPSGSMEFGTAAHALLLEGLDIVQVCHFDDWRTKDARAERDEARAAGKIPLLERQYSDLQNMVAAARGAVADCPDLDGYKLSQGAAEEVLYTQDGLIHVRHRLDWLSDDKALILDYKTTEISSPQAWARSIAGNGYDMQAAAYCRTSELIHGKKPRFVFMVQEVNAPYFCYFVGLSPFFEEIGAAKWAIARNMWGECLSRDEWPGYPQRIMYTEPPAWAIADSEERQVDHAGWSKEAFLFGQVKGE